MKKIISIITVLFIMASMAMCSYAGEQAPEGDGSQKPLEIVATIFPIYDWTQNVLGDQMENNNLTLLMGNGVDLHSFQPSVEDIMRVSSCDLFIYVGGESDAWVENVLQTAVNDQMVTLNLMDVLADHVKEEEIVEGMQEEEQHHDEEEAGEEHEHDSEEAGEEHEHSSEEETEYDEHVWLSLRNAQQIVTAIADALAGLDPDHAQDYQNHAAAYTDQLTALDLKYQEVVDAAEVDTLLFGDRFPFRYFTDDYGLSYYAAFSGCSAETEASFDTVIFLAQKIDELGLHHVMTIEGTDQRIAETIIQNTQTKDQDILSLNSMQSVTNENMAAGVTYLSIMEDNLEVLKVALN